MVRLTSPVALSMAIIESLPQTFAYTLSSTHSSSFSRLTSPSWSVTCRVDTKEKSSGSLNASSEVPLDITKWVPS